MQGVVYVDILVLVNAIVGYFVLRCAAFLAAREVKPWRLCAGAVLAGISALLMLWPNLAWPLALAAKCLFAAGIVAVSFYWQGARVFWKSIFWYIALNLLLGGVVTLAVFYGAGNIRYENFSLYVHVSPILLIACILLMYVLIQGAAYLFGKPKPQQHAAFSATVQDKTVTGMALLDTGMHLRDAMTGESAVLCSFPTLRAQLPQKVENDLNTYFISGMLEQPLWIVMVKTATGMRALPAVRGETLTVNKHEKQQPVLVFTPETLLDGGCGLLLHPDFLRER